MHARKTRAQHWTSECPRARPCFVNTRAHNAARSEPPRVPPSLTPPIPCHGGHHPHGAGLLPATELVAGDVPKEPTHPPRSPRGDRALSADQLDPSLAAAPYSQAVRALPVHDLLSSSALKAIPRAQEEASAWDALAAVGTVGHGGAAVGARHAASAEPKPL